MFTKVCVALLHLLIERQKRNASQFEMEKIFNIGIPHLSEQIFKSIDNPGLVQCALVSKTWRELAQNVLKKRWKSKMLEACINGETNVVQQLLESPTSEEVGLNIKDHLGFTPLIWACYNGYKDIVKLLLDHSERIELNKRNDCEERAFMNA